MLKMAAVCFAVAVALCCVWYWACGGRTSEEGAAAVLRSGNESSDMCSLLCLTAGFFLHLGNIALSLSLSLRSRLIFLLHCITIFGSVFQYTKSNIRFAMQISREKHQHLALIRYAHQSLSS
jgi:hypothetical protein